MDDEVHQVGEWRFRASSFELERARDGVRARLPHRLGRLLARLVAEPGEVVTREALIGSAWDRRGVADEVLSRSMNALRDALGDSARAPRYIETIPKRGYRLVAATSRVPATAADARAAASRIRAPGAGRPWVSAALVVALLSLLFGALASRRGPPAASLEAPPTLLLAAERPLTSRSGWELGPALSPDGRLVAYAEVDGAQGPSRLVVAELDGAGRRVLHEQREAASPRPEFSPDGRALAFRRIERGTCTLAVASVVSGDVRTLAACANVAGGLAWSPDGARIAYTAPPRDGVAPGLALVALADHAVVPLTFPPLAEGPDVDPRFVPGTPSISFTRGEGSDRALWTVALAAPHATTPLFAGANLIHGHAWFPGGRHLVLATDAPGYRALVRFEPATGASEVLGGRGARFPAVGAGRIAYEHAQYDANVWRIALDGSDAAPSRLTTSSRYDSAPAVAPDGRRFAFASIRDGLDSIWIGSTERADEARLPLPRETRWVRPHWHPDGASLLVTAYLEGATRAFRHELASGRTFPLESFGEAFGAADMQDAESIVFARRSARGHALWRARSGAPPERIEGADEVEEFHAGDGFVAYTRVAQAGLVVHELDGASARLVLAGAIGASNRYDWTVRGRFVYYAAHDAAGEARLHRFDTRDETVAVLAPARPDAAGPTLSISPDGRFALVARVDELLVDLVAVPFR